jgi:UV excision repair protein RAD23
VPTPTPAPAPQTQTPAPQTTPAPQQQPQTAEVGNSLVYGPQLQQMISNFEEMGFQRADIDKALRAAFNNPERATEYLLNGIPPELEQIANAPRPQAAPQQAQQQQQAPQAQQTQAPNPLQQLLQQQAQQQAQQPQQAPQQQAQQGLGGLASILSMVPQFNQLRSAIQQNPELLQPLMQRIAQQNPELFQVISQNPQEFIRLLNEPVPQGGQQAARGGLQGLLGQGAPQGGQQPPPGTIYVTQQEKEAIDRLVGLGFDRLTATQAYFACDKNENLAANFLLESGGFGDDMEGGDYEEGDFGEGGQQ